MYARLATFNVGSGMWERMTKAADKAASHYKAQKGFRSVTFLGDDAGGGYGSFSVWESKEDAEAAGEALRPFLQEEVSDIIQGPPSVRVFEVYEPEA
ncbi:MAG: antibiotic biosynthesis monooxygenase family protein [Nitrospinota bacterium]